MNFLAIFLIVYGVLLMYLTLTKAPFIFKNFKVKAMIQKLGYPVTISILIGVSILFFVAGLLILQP
jgi:energy-converting hydrogenase Eha subunit G